MKRGKLPESQGQRRKRLAQQNQAREKATTWVEENRELFEQYWRAYKHRLESDEAYNEFEALRARVHAVSPAPPTNEDPYHSGTEPLAFSVALQRASDHRVTDWDILIDYLERDPYTQSSGYTKQKILRRLKRAALTESQRERLREMLLVQVTRPRRREWQEYSRLALVLETPTFRERLRELVEREGTWAQAMLGALQTVNGRELC